MGLSVLQLAHGLGQGKKCKISLQFWKETEGAVTSPGLFRAGIAQEKKKLCQNDFPECRAQCSSGYHPWTALGLSCWLKCLCLFSRKKYKGRDEMWSCSAEINQPIGVQLEELIMEYLSKCKGLTGKKCPCCQRAVTDTQNLSWRWGISGWLIRSNLLPVLSAGLCQTWPQSCTLGCLRGHYSTLGLPSRVRTQTVVPAQGNCILS